MGGEGVSAIMSRPLSIMMYHSILITPPNLMLSNRRVVWGPGTPNLYRSTWL